MRKSNEIKKNLKNGDFCIGTWSVIPSASTADIMAVAGFDFVIIDMEHGPASFDIAENMVRALEGEGTSPLIRVPCNHAPTVLRALEIGAHGIVVPQIETADAAREVVSAVKYVPEGKRGVSVFTRSSGYDARGQEGRADKENSETMIVILVEGIEGIKNLESITDVEGIDVIYIGTYDLSQSLGMTDKADSPEVYKEVEKCVKKIKEKGIACGVLAQNEDDIRWLKKIGAQFIVYSVDCAIFHQACSSAINSFKNILEKK